MRSDVDNNRCCFFSGLIKSEQLWASAPVNENEGNLKVWKSWGCHAVNDNSTNLKEIHLLFSY